MKLIIKIVTMLLAVVLLLSGCTMRTAKDMYRIPKRSDNFNNLQAAIDTAMSDLEYCAPLSGENRQTVQMADLDGDGESEYLLFAKGSHEKPLRILVFRNIGDSYENIATVECNGSAFDQVEYIQLDNNSGVEIVVGRQVNDQVIRSLSVYSLQDQELVQLVSVNYTKLLATDLDEDGLSELFLLRPGQTDADNGVAELYSVKNGSIERYNEVSMSQPVDKLKRIIIGKLDGGKTAVFTASSIGDTALITDVYTVLDGKLANVTLSNESGTSVQTMRNFYVYADDIDSDTVVELPYLITMKPMPNVMSADRHHLIRWYAMTVDGSEIDKVYTYHNFVGGWYLQLDAEWAQRVTVVNVGNQYEFFIWDKEYKTTQKFMTLYSLTGQSREDQGTTDERFILLRSDSAVYAAHLEEGAAELGLTKENIIYSFRLIQEDWKTGET